MKSHLAEERRGLITTLGFAGVARNTASLTRVKKLLREGRVIWLNIRIGEAHRHNPSWVVSVCRTAHRAGVPWTIRFTMINPGALQPYATLRKHKYVCFRRFGKEISHPDVRLTSDGVNLDELTELGICKQATARVHTAGNEEAVAVMRDGLLEDTLGNDMTRRQQRAAEDAAGLGGLRNPRKCLERMPQAIKGGESVRKVIDAITTRIGRS